jgi:putative SOS response-associated peptidase YedK
MLAIGIDTAGRRAAMLLRWGLIPSWVKDPKEFSLLVNARSESVVDKPSFRYAMRYRRILVPASGFYEWRRPADRKLPRQAFWIRPRGGGLVAFGGLMEHWAGKDGSEIDTGLILTTNANATIASIHDRMPVIVPPEHFGRWLDCRNVSPAEVADLLLPPTADMLEAIPVGDRVNRIANDGPELQRPLTPAAAGAAPGAGPPAAKRKPAAKSADQPDLF